MPGGSRFTPFLRRSKTTGALKAVQKKNELSRSRLCQLFRWSGGWTCGFCFFEPHLQLRQGRAHLSNCPCDSERFVLLAHRELGRLAMVTVHRFVALGAVYSMFLSFCGFTTRLVLTYSRYRAIRLLGYELRMRVQDDGRASSFYMTRERMRRCGR